MRAFVLLAPVLLLGTGCLTPLIAKERAARVEGISRFDSGCGAMRLVQRIGHRRYMLRGCGRTFVYACHDRQRVYWDRDAETIDFLLTGGMDPDPPCHLVMTRRDPPRRVARRTVQRVQQDPAEAAGTLDEPGMEALDAPARPTAGATRLPRLPEPAEIKRVMTGLTPALRRCGLPRALRLTVHLRLDATGAVTGATIQGDALRGKARQCVEQQILSARVPPFRSGPVTLAYLFDLR